MNRSQADPGRTWSTEFVERAIKQPVRDAVREALDAHDAVERTNRSADDASGESDASGGATDDSDATASSDADGDDTASGRPSAWRLLLVAGVVAGAAYAATRRRRSDDAPTDGDDADDVSTDIDIEDAVPDGERPTAPAEDATTN